MYGQEKFDRFVAKHPHAHKTFFNRPHWTRRDFFQILGAGVTASYLAGKAKAGSDCTPRASVKTQNTAKNVIFILLAGAPSHIDTFDFKMVPGVTPANFAPDTKNGIVWPFGLLPKLGAQIPNLCIVRSMQAWALVHSLAQRWTQIGRNPAAALGDVAPNIGSVIAREKDPERTAGQVFPTFLALNSNAAAGPGYFPATDAPFEISPATTGLPDTTNPAGQSVLNDRLSLLHSLDDPLRINSPLGKPPEDYDEFYKAARSLMYNNDVMKAFTFTPADSMRYGNSSFGNACLVAKQVLAANQGTRFIQITLGSWDMHQDIYGQANPRGANLYTLGKTFDNGVGVLLDDLKRSGLLDQTLVVMVGEFGRTVGPLSAAGGRDHWKQQSIVFAGAGVHGGRTIGTTNADGSDTADYGWSRNRYVKPEDVEATIYSAMGINWTTLCTDDPFHRGFEYVPFSDQDLYGPINELWA